MDATVDPLGDAGRDTGFYWDVDLGPPRYDAGPPDSGTPPAATIAQGPDVLIDVFVVPAGIVVVLRDTVLLFDRAGVELAR